MSGIQSYVSGKSAQKKRKEKYYALLKFGTLFLFDSENDSDCKLLIPIYSYKASLYPEELLDHEVYSRPNAIKLTRIGSMDNDKATLASAPVPDSKKPATNEEEFTAGDVFYIFCDQPIDKEDWYFAFLEASSSMPEDPIGPNTEFVDNTHFDQIALNQLIKTLQEDSSHRHAQWLNAILGRIFLAVYKTDRIEEFIYHKVSKKARKVKRPGFIGEISVQSVKPGHSLPYITRPKLLSLSQTGELQAQANIHYAGSFRLEIATDITWSYSSMMKPIKVHVVLSVMLKKLTGKVLVKIKAPPTNRLWIGFYEPPQMDWKIEPIVSDKPIKLSMVTNAIESKIREFMIENMVLPNMDDFPFFETDGLGGIFGERKER
ncbi:putative integral membrane protein conserved region-domain-containing protein, partial [Umbelopsis sp. PMI_123]